MKILAKIIAMNSKYWSELIKAFKELQRIRKNLERDAEGVEI